jgi:hypothetical protein
MAGFERHAERIRALIEEVDRVCRESESVTSDIDQSMKRGAFYPERRKSPRYPSSESDWRSERNGSA